HGRFFRWVGVCPARRRARRHCCVPPRSHPLKRDYAHLRVEQLEDRTCPAPLKLPAMHLKFDGMSYFISNNTFATDPNKRGLGITDATQAVAPGLSDAYDGAFVLEVNGVAFKDPDGVVDLTGSTLTSDVVTLSGLQTQVQYFFDPNSPTVRVLFSFTNPSANTIAVVATVDSDLGSDGATTIEASSSSDKVVDPTDRTFVSSDFAPFDDPVLGW